MPDKEKYLYICVYTQKYTYTHTNEYYLVIRKK